MKGLSILFFAIVGWLNLPAQSSITDTNYATRITSAEWMEDGKSLLLAVVKFHKTKRDAPFFSRVFSYDIATTRLTPLFDNGSSINPTPDGKSIMFLKRDVPKRKDVYIYNLNSNQETLIATDTLDKGAMKLSPDGKKLLYNSTLGLKTRSSGVEIFVLDLATKQTKQITNSGKDKSYSPVWSPDGKKIVYYLEKGDGRDQIWLTDPEGSFHTNLTNDTSTHNYFPSWLDDKTIAYTQSPSMLMKMNIDGSNRQMIASIPSDAAEYNANAGLFVYVISEEENKVVLYDLKKKSTKVILHGTKMIERF